ncbi:MAG: hypothetical protein JOZ17_04200 [Acetobacteraceae bacterium]|nr:hypothetical protein [Acetobacteraceae bacterium]
MMALPRRADSATILATCGLRFGGGEQTPPALVQEGRQHVETDLNAFTSIIAPG